MATVTPMKSIQIDPSITNGTPLSANSTSAQSINLNILLELPPDKPIEIHEGFILSQNGIIWNAMPEDADTFIIDSPRMSLEVLFAGAELYHGKKEVFFSFWEYSGARLTRKSDTTVTLIDTTCDKRSPINPYFKEIEFEYNDFITELIVASDQLIYFFEGYTTFIEKNLPEGKLRSQLLYDIHLDGWHTQRQRIS